MKNLFVFLILSYGQLVALDKDSTLKIYHHVFAALSSAISIVVYTDNEEYRKIFALSKRMTLTSDPKNANIALITNQTALKHILREERFAQSKTPHTVLFVTDYHLLKESEDIVGAFYWRKGRSQLLFIRKRLEKQHIRLPSEYKKFIVDEL